MAHASILAAGRSWRRPIGGLALLLTLAVATSCTGSGSVSVANSHDTATSGGSVEPTTAVPATTPPTPVALAIAPAANAANVSPASPVTAQVNVGSFTAVTLTTASGRAVGGTFDAARTSWHNDGALSYDTSYTLTVSGTGADGAAYHQTRSFRTVRPNNLTLPYLRANDATLLDGGTFGVGQPVVVWFDEAITDRAAAERSLSVTTTPSGIVGGWYWMNSHEVHWRPQEYWPAGTKVAVTASVYGRNLGGGLYGQSNRSASFTIGPSKIAIADSKTHRMKVYFDGVQVTRIANLDVTAGIPISVGKGGTERVASGVVDFTTNSGPHVITMKYEVYHMTSSSFGITDPKDHNFYAVDIKKSIRISGDGEFVHLRDWDTWQLGKQNTSHGCVNVGAPYIYWFYDNFGAGDIVDVTGTNRHLDVHNGLGDWVLSWADWQKGSALS